MTTIIIIIPPALKYIRQQRRVGQMEKDGDSVGEQGKENGKGYNRKKKDNNSLCDLQRRFPPLNPIPLTVYSFMLIFLLIFFSFAP